MNESTALARRLASQLGDDLDRILGQEPAADVYIDTRQDTGVELRQIAGLTAGAAMRLSDGSYQFGQSDANQRGLNEGQPEQVGFSLTVKDNEAWIEAGTAEVTLDGEPINGPTKVGDAVIEVGSARFMVATPRQPSRRRQGSAPTIEPIEGPIEVPELPGAESSQQTKSRSSLLSALRGNTQADPAGDILTRLVRENRNEVLRRRRGTHPHPEEVVYRARNARSLAWDRRSDHPHFGQASIAYGDLPWRPQFDRPDRVSTQAADQFRDLHSVPSVPITADLQRGPLGIIGSRPSVLAVARHVMVTLATLTPPADLTIAVLADDDRAMEWTWADQLPHNAPDDDQAFPILVVDGLHHVAEAGLAQALNSPGGFGCVLLGDNIDDLPPVCSSVLLIDDAGTATVIDNRDGTTVMRTTPLGLTPDLAALAVNSLRSLADSAG